MIIDAALLKEIERKHLRYISEISPGIRRFKKGSSFSYIEPNGIKIINPNTIERINSLGIPPAWKDVWISTNPHGHIQAIGFDSKGRKQYIYHPTWTEITQENKFNHLLDFCQSLPKIRGKVRRDLKINRLVKEKILATVVWLLENTFIRVGNDEYAKENKSYGLTTLRNKHVKISKGKVIFEFIGKSGIKHTVEITDPQMIKTIKRCVEIPGYSVFQYFDEDKKIKVVDSGDINNYLQEISGQEISAKDFRTWGATLLSASHLNLLGPFIDERDLKSKETQTVKKVSQHLRNTPKVCRTYYIHPTIFQTYEKNILIPHFTKYKSNKKISKPSQISKEEFIVVDLLNKYA